MSWRKTNPLRLLLLCSKKIKEPTTTWESNVPLKQIEKADILETFLQSDNMDITREAQKLQAQFQIRTEEQEKLKQQLQEEEDEKNAEEAANAEPESVEEAEEETKESEEDEQEQEQEQGPTTNGVSEPEAADENETEEVADATLRNRKGQQQGKPSTMKKGKRTKGRLGGQKTMEVEESAEQENANQEKPNDFLLLLTQYLAIILAFFGNFLGTATEYGAQAFNTTTDFVGNALQDICPKRSKSKRKAPAVGGRA